MCLENIKVKRQPIKKCQFAYKVFKKKGNGLMTNIAEMPVRVNTEIWQNAYQRVPSRVERYTDYNKETHNGKISVFLTLKDAKSWASDIDQIWLVEIRYDKLLVGQQYMIVQQLQGALVDEFRLVRRVK